MAPAKRHNGLGENLNSIEDIHYVHAHKERPEAHGDAVVIQWVLESFSSSQGQIILYL